MENDTIIVIFGSQFCFRTNQYPKQIKFHDSGEH